MKCFEFMRYIAFNLYCVIVIEMLDCRKGFYCCFVILLFNCDLCKGIVLFCKCVVELLSSRPWEGTCDVIVTVGCDLAFHL